MIKQDAWMVPEVGTTTRQLLTNPIVKSGSSTYLEEQNVTTSMTASIV